MGVYKEGEGIWARGAMALVVFIVGVYAAFRLHAFLLVTEGSMWSVLMTHWEVPGLGFTLDMRLIPVTLLLLAFFGFGLWAYNHPKIVDFLSETENELRTRVTWPTKNDLVNGSIVVVVVVILIGAWVFVADWILVHTLRQGVYRWLSKLLS